LALFSSWSPFLLVFVFVVAMALGMYLHTWAIEWGATKSSLTISPANTTQDA
jgi:hypothetical protein